jgi:hypothetical protein
VIETYRERVRGRVETEAPPVDHVASGEAQILSVVCLNSDGAATGVVRTGEPVTFRVSYRSHATVADARLDLYAFTMMDDRFGPWCHFSTAGVDECGMALHPGDGVIEFRVESLGLLPGTCRLIAELARRDDPPGRSMGWCPDCLTLTVAPGPRVRGTFYQPHQWRIADGSSARAVPRNKGAGATE